MWRRHLPMVGMHYAVKSNDDIKLLNEMVRMGTGFDCASKYEIQRVL